MKKINLVWAAAAALLVIAFLYTTEGKAASYDVKENVAVVAAERADRVGIQADKVMNGITDVTITQSKDGNVQKFILQCDATTKSINMFYYLNDTLGTKAKSATNFRVTVYGNGDEGFIKGGDVTVFDGQLTTDNLRKGLEKLNALGGAGFINFEIVEAHDGIDNPIAYSYLIPSSYGQRILQAVDGVQGSEGCDIDGGFVSMYSLKSLKDSI
ncbi:hypothetical protein OBP_303 [Pseudomonas phage OBP]|uniref:hypothetical protein n=1 Tax=Pseudomonas phage OBP TaxID=1124849 RepID=UPI000240D64A|nr:hypothetical protein OBP_303 [Pseudomonas phage OBP]AEV89740.1 hypothetical protein OBP_303 [Pseudomonas phage OBP]